MRKPEKQVPTAGHDALMALMSRIAEVDTRAEFEAAVANLRRSPLYQANLRVYFERYWLKPARKPVSISFIQFNIIF